jgi:hypothetical protein
MLHSMSLFAALGIDNGGSDASQPFKLFMLSPRTVVRQYFAHWHG